MRSRTEHRAARRAAVWRAAGGKGRTLGVAAAAGVVLAAAFVVPGAIGGPAGAADSSGGTDPTASGAGGEPGAESPVRGGSPDLPAPKVDMAIVRGSEDEGRTVNLTLDDGPDPRWTPKALELLKKYQAKAVFCMTGPNAAAHPELVRRVIAEGHRLCDHSISHDTAMDKKPVDHQRKEILDAKAMIDAASGGERIWYYRAPGGAFTPESRQIAASEGMRNLGWNVDPSDYEQPGTERIVKAVKNQLAKGPTVLMHDGGGNRAQTMEALEQLLPWFKEQGYAFSFPKAG
ncbi:polysaccharide deacetylase family protein [Streptomyces sp. NPDC090025]|uniref:polysaccharide deacetylase family protein n=1 Tax=Streptomyces sp. NPDC090025 TaxID=3365922 RepID=UPI0038362471